MVFPIFALSMLFTSLFASEDYQVRIIFVVNNWEMPDKSDIGNRAFDIAFTIKEEQPKCIYECDDVRVNAKVWRDKQPVVELLFEKKDQKGEYQECYHPWLIPLLNSENPATITMTEHAGDKIAGGLALAIYFYQNKNDFETHVSDTIPQEEGIKIWGEDTVAAL